MGDILKTIEKQKGEYTYFVEIRNDDFGDNPRNWDNLFIFDLYHSQYDLGDIKRKGCPFDTIKEWEDNIKENNPDLMMIEKVYLYDHSGISINIGGRRDCWDSSFIGFVYTTKKQLEKVGTPENLMQEVLNSEIKTYNQYLSGEVYDTMIYFKGCLLDSCGGFFGEDFKNNGLNDFIEETINNHSPITHEKELLKVKIEELELELTTKKERLKLIEVKNE